MTCLLNCTGSSNFLGLVPEAANARPAINAKTATKEAK